jgi:hypothetical protein
MQQQEPGLNAAPAASGRRAAYRAPDAKLLELVRARNTTAYDILVARHLDAARRLARIMVTPAEVDRVVAEALAEVRDATLLGRGPDEAFRPYLLAVLRRVSAGLVRTDVPADTVELPETAEPASDPVAADLGTLPIVRAFRSLPERWIAVLWHTEIEETIVPDLTRILGTSLVGVAALRSRAVDELRQAYLREHVSEAANPVCQKAAKRLAAFFWDTASRRDKAMVTKHLGRCDECRAMYAEFTDIDIALRSVVAQALLGAAAASYLDAAHHAAARASRNEAAAKQNETAASASLGAEAPAAAETRSLGPACQPRYKSRRLRRLGAASVAGLAVAAATLLVLAAQGLILTPTHHRQNLAAVAPPTAPAITPQPTQTPTVPPAPSPAPAGTPPANAATTPVASLAAAPVPPAPAPAQLSATVDVHAAGTGSADQVAFTVADTGGTATVELIVSLDLPGSSLPQFGSSSENGDGWNCQQARNGASCQHDGIQAGGRADGSLLISVSDPEEACGRPISLTAVSGNASASTQSPEGIQCQRQSARQ